MTGVNNVCNQCPRHCCANRESKPGYCRVPSGFAVSRCDLHPYEEPCLCGKSGAGTIFFAGCNLQCVYCQNRPVSHADEYVFVSDDTLIRMILDLQESGAGSLDLVTPTHYTARLSTVLRKVRPKLRIPVVWNSGGYETADSLRRLEGLVDIWMPDMKYFDPALSARFSDAPDYFEVASAALGEMIRQTGVPVFDDSGNLKKGVLVRHLVLPGHRDDSIRLLGALDRLFPDHPFLLSLLNQYTPEFAQDSPYPELHRRLTSFEYGSVLDVADSLGFEGYRQQKGSASAAYTPDFTKSVTDLVGKYGCKTRQN